MYEQIGFTLFLKNDTEENFPASTISTISTSDSASFIDSQTDDEEREPTPEELEQLEKEPEI